MKKFLTAVGAAVVFIAGISLLALISAYPVKWALNYTLAPSVLMSIFGVAKVGALRAFCVSYLAAVLIKGGSKQ